MEVDFVRDGAGVHNSIYRGLCLGDAYTESQKSAVASGTFEDLFVGDYWTIDGRNYLIAGFDYWLNTGDAGEPTNFLSTHHVVVVPEAPLYNAKMNDTDTITGAYGGSKMRTTYLGQADSIIQSAFGASSLLEHQEFVAHIVNSDTGVESNCHIVNSIVDLMNEVMVYGCEFYHNQHGGGSNSYQKFTYGITQLPLFRFRPDLIRCRESWWLRDVCKSAHFCIVSVLGCCDYDTASKSYGVRPAFGLK